MRCRPLPPDEPAADILARFRQQGSVLDTSFWRVDDDEADEADDGAAKAERIGRAALLSRLEGLIAENARLRAALPPGSPSWTLSRLEGHEPVGARITVQELVGETFDAATGELRMFDFGPDYRSRSPRSSDDLPRALLNPPYGLLFPEIHAWPKSVEAEPAYHVACGRLLCTFLEGVVGISLTGDDATPPVILAWSTDWTNYFDAGREWWGTFCWTIQRPADRVVVVLMASSTD